MEGRMFGNGKRRKALIMELVEHRMRMFGVDDRKIRLEIKQLGTFRLMSVPEAIIVTVVETALIHQKRGQLLHHTLERMERQRKLVAHNGDLFNKILQQAVGNNPAEALVSYSLYRIKVEKQPAASMFDLNVTAELVSVAYQEISCW
jgi:DNA-binding sugar fermentation-stimulating protein